jgi:hypothetical protein
MSSWGTPSRISSDLYRERTAATPPVSLSRRRCACGKVVTAKQLTQYGACAACVLCTPSQAKEAR